MSECGKLINFPTRHCGVLPHHPMPSGVEGRIAAFVAGESDGSELLHALYDHVLGEPIPPVMMALLRE